MRQQLGTHTWLATSNVGVCVSRVQVHYLCYWSLGAPPMATTVHQTYKLQTYTVLQGSTRPGWYLSWSSPETTAKHQISRQQTTQHSSHYQHFFLGLLPIGTVTRTAPETINQLFPSVSALFTDSSIDILSRDTTAVTGWCPLLDIYRRTEEPSSKECRPNWTACGRVPNRARDFLRWPALLGYCSWQPAIFLSLFTCVTVLLANKVIDWATTAQPMGFKQNPNCQSSSTSLGEHNASNFGSNWKLICDFLLVIKTNLIHPTLHRFQVMADYWSNFHIRKASASL